MISQITKLKTENLYPLNKVGNIVKEPEKNVEDEMILKDNKDVLVISENGKIDLSLFNFLDKGGEASEVLSENLKRDVAFSIKPDFKNVSTARHAQLKTEIERNFADDPSSKSKYLNALDKALDDYIQIQTKMIDEKLDEVKNLAPNEASEDIDMEIDETKVIENDETEDNETNIEKEKIDESKNSENQSGIDKEEAKKFYNASYEEMKAVFEKIFGDSQSNYTDEMSAIVDDFLFKSLIQGANNAKES